MHPFELLRAASVEEACSLLAECGEEAKAIAGGTSLLLFLKERIVEPRRLVSLGGLAELRGIEEGKGGGVRIGALATLRDLEHSRLLLERAPMLVQAVREVANIRIRNVATLGGNLCHADPHSDPAPALVCLKAQLRIASPSGERLLPLEEFLLDYYQTALTAGELLTEVFIPPLPPTWRTAYQRFTPLSEEDWPCAGVAVAVELRDAVVTALRLVVSAVNPVPLRVRGVEEIVVGKTLSAARLDEVAALAAAQVEPVSDFRGSEWYKRRIVHVLTKRTIAQAVDASGANER